MANASTSRARTKHSTHELFARGLAAAKRVMGESSAELAIAGELARGRAIFALSVLFTVVAGVACVVCIAQMGLTAGFGPALPSPPAPPPAPPPPLLTLVLREVTWWSIAGA